MAAEQDGVVFPDESQDLDDDEEPSSSDNDDDVLMMNENDDGLINDEEEDEEELEEEEDNNSFSPSTSSQQPPKTAAAAVVAASEDVLPLVPLAVPAVTVASVAAEESAPDPKRSRIADVVIEKKPPAPQQFDESRRLFQRLWTDEDEIELLRGFLDYTNQRGNSNSHHHHHDTAVFYDQIKSKLQLDFNKNQLVEKLRRLKKKYRNVMSKISSGKEFSFKSPHDHATFEISKKIWSSSVEKAEDNVLDEEENANNTNFNDDSVDKKATPKSRKRSRSRTGAKVDDKRVLNDGFVLNNISNYNNSNANSNVNNNNGNVESLGGGGGAGGGNLAAVVEETVRSCMSPLFKELLSSAVSGGVCGVRGP